MSSGLLHFTAAWLQPEHPSQQRMRVRDSRAPVLKHGPFSGTQIVELLEKLECVFACSQVFTPNWLRSGKLFNFLLQFPHL